MSLSIYVYYRGLGSSAGRYISTHQLFFIICQLLSSPLLCLLTDSLAAACGMGKGTCQNYTCSLSSSTNKLTTDGDCWKQQLTQHCYVPHGSSIWSLCSGSKWSSTERWSLQFLETTCTVHVQVRKAVLLTMVMMQEYSWWPPITQTIPSQHRINTLILTYNCLWLCWSLHQSPVSSCLSVSVLT